MAGRKLAACVPPPISLLTFDKGDLVRRSLSVLVCLVAVALLGASPAWADGQQSFSHSNIISLDNSNSSSPMVRSGTVLAYDEGNSVTDTNMAYAHSFNCTGCRTVAVAVQVVVYAGIPSNIQPQNAAVAVNENCHACQTFAYAHQYLVQAVNGAYWQDSYGPQLWSIQSKISQVAHSGEDFATMSSQLDQLSLQFYNAVLQAVQSQTHGEGALTGEQRQLQQKD